jgi:hypothetical protein
MTEWSGNGFAGEATRLCLQDSQRRKKCISLKKKTKLKEMVTIKKHSGFSCFKDFKLYTVNTKMDNLQTKRIDTASTQI